MKSKKKLLFIAAAAIAVCAIIGAVIVSAAEPETGKDGVFNGSPAHVLVEEGKEDKLYIDSINFPDEGFREYVNYFDNDKDTYLNLEECLNVNDISLFGGPHGEKILDLKGIEFFTNISTLDVGYNSLPTLDLPKNNSLTRILCRDNNILELYLPEKSNLEYLDCGQNIISELDLTNCSKLKLLLCDGNIITRLDLSKNTALESLDCHGNNLTNLNISNCPLITTLNCSDNYLTDIDISSAISIVELSVIVIASKHSIFHLIQS